MNKTIIIAIQWSRILKEKDQHLQELRELVTIDRLTGVCNKMAIEEILDTEIIRSNKYKSPLCVLFIDIDHFKRINDNYGHVFGDKVLKEVAGFLKKNVRRTYFMGRWGGEEFLIITPGIQIRDAYIMAKKLKRIISNYWIEQSSNVSISIGVSELQQDDSGKTIIDRADCALYKAKRNGRNRVELESPNMDFQFQ